MPDTSPADYCLLDSPYVLSFLFHPRPGYGPNVNPAAQDVSIAVEEGVVIGARFHIADRRAVNILFFHGNGEIVDDYDQLGPLYNRVGINFLAVGYRGYGNSTGTPTASAMMSDSHHIFRYVAGWLQDGGYQAPLILMGRSLGSASALELANSYPDEMAGLIIESGFAYTGPLLQLIGIDTQALGFTEDRGVQNLEKIRSFSKATLIIHAEFDHIIPFSEGQALHDASPATDKRLLKIPYANHNNIFTLGWPQYLEAVTAFVNRLR